MNILFLTRLYFPAVKSGGPIFKMKSLADGLIRRGHRVTVWTTDVLFVGEKMPGAPFQRDVGGASVYYHATGPGIGIDHIVPGFGRFCRERLVGFDVMHIF